jgi:hypothetical protein
MSDIGTTDIIRTIGATQTLISAIWSTAVAVLRIDSPLPPVKFNP